MGHGALSLTQRGSPHGRRIFGSGCIEIAPNEGLSSAGYMMMRVAAAALGRGAVHHRENLLRMYSDHSVLLSKTLGNSALEL